MSGECPEWTGEALVAAQARVTELEARLRSLREMERERNMYRHAFDRLVTRVTNTMRPSDTVDEVDETLDICTRVIVRLRKGHSFATELAAMARVYEKKAP